MKSLHVSLLAVSFSALAACEGSAVMQSDTRTIELTSGQSRNTVQITHDSVASSDAPYALQGMPSAMPAAPTGSGYQAR